MADYGPDENPLDPGVSDPQPEVMPLDELIQHGIDASTMRLRVCMPCKVVAVSGNQEVDLQPLFMSRYVSGDLVMLPVLKSVPVSMPMGQQWGVRYPLAVGDLGLAIFADRSLDSWLAGNGGPVDVQDMRQHDLNDAIFVPGFVPTGQQTTDTTSNLTIKNGKAFVQLEPGGKVRFGNGTQELLDLISQMLALQINLLQSLQTNTFTLTALGPMPFIASSIAAFQQLTSTAQQIQQNLGVLKD